jgi:hypothetical protein
LLIGATRLVDPNWFPPEFNLIHDFTRILCVFLGQKLAKSVALVSHRDSIFGKMNVHCNTTINMEQEKQHDEKYEPTGPA